MRFAFLAIGLVACGGSPPSPAADAPAGSEGLSFQWQAALPGKVTPTVTVTRATFALQGFHAISDAGNTETIDDDALTWDATTTPAPLALADAAPGMYSRLAFKLDGETNEESYRIEGTVQVSSTVMPFRIHDHTAAVSYSLDLATTLAPGGAAQIALSLDLANAIGGVDFATLRNENGTLDLDSDDLQIPAFRARLASAFSVR